MENMKTTSVGTFHPLEHNSMTPHCPVPFLILQMLDLPVGLVVNFGKRALQIRGVRPPKG